MHTPKPNRDFAIDWLRIFAMLMVFLFHCGRFFDYGDWHVKNNQLDFTINIFVLFLNQWIMPLFFILSGIASFYSLSYHKPSEYLKSRFKRLFIPLVFGIFVLIPPQVYFERISHDQYTGSFIQFFPHYFDGFYAFGGNFAWMGLHLWYLQMLFIFTILTLPFFIYARMKKGQDFISKLIALFAHKSAIYLLALPFTVLELILDPAGIGRRDFGGWSPFLYIIFYIYGFTVFIGQRWRSIIDQNRKMSLYGGILITAVMLILFLLKNSPSFGTPYFTVMTILRAFNTWFWLLAIMGLGARHFKFNHKILAYAGEAVLPFYILHQTIIVTIGFYLISWDVPVLLKYLVLSTTSFAAIVLIYEWIIRRMNLLRYLFGMKPTNIQ